MIELIWLLPLIGIPFSLLISRKKGLIASFPPLISLASLLTLPGKLPLRTSFLGLPLLIDEISFTFSLVVSFIGSVVLIYSNKYMGEEEGLNRYYSVMLLFLSSMMLLVQSNNLLGFYAGWELVGFCSYFLIAFYYKRKAARDAGIKAFIVTRIGDIALLLGILMVYMETGSLSFSSVRQTATPLLSMLFLIGAMAKSAQIPFHIWLPDAMEGPTPVSALLHSATMVKAGVYLIARFYPCFSKFLIWQYSVLIVGGISAFLASIMAVFSYDIKELLAYSTISQIGYLFLAAGSGSLLAMSFHLVNHALFKALLFLGAGCIIHIAGTRKIPEIGKIGNKRVIVPFLVGSLALASIPPFGSYFSKEAIINSVFNFPIPYFLSIITIPFTFLYALKVPLKIFSEKERKEKLSNYLTLPLLLLSILVASSLVFKPPLKSYFGLVHHHPITAVYSLLGLTFGGILLYYLYYRTELELPRKLKEKTLFSYLYKLAKRKFYLDISRRISRAYVSLGDFISRFEELLGKSNLIVESYKKLTDLTSGLELIYREVTHFIVDRLEELSNSLSNFEIDIYTGLNTFLTKGNKATSKIFRRLEVEELDKGVLYLVLGIIFILGLQLLLI